MPHTLLIAEDEPVQRTMLVKLLTKKLDYEVEAVAHGKAALDRVMESNIDAFSAVILDLHMPQMDGFEALKHIKKYRPDLPVLILTASDETEDAVRAIKEGASDFIVKPPQPAQLDVMIQNAIRLSTLARELGKMKRDKEGALSFADLVGERGGMAQAIAYGRKAAASNVPVLLSGETGVGKELFARAVHGESRRVGAPFVAVNCSAIPEHLVESALFHPEKGAFRRAESGTIFLDDIERLSPEDQVRLLRLLQHKDIESTLSPKPVKVNVRVIAATSVDLARAIQEGRFREDLYFRLAILPIHLPALRERPQDIVPMAEHFMQRLAATEGLQPRTLEVSAKTYLVAGQWAGNVRELENVIHRAMVLAEHEVIDAEVLQHVHGANHAASQPVERRRAPELQIDLKTVEGNFKPMARLEKEIMRLALTYFAGNVAQAAEALGMAKSTFYRNIKDEAPHE